MSAYAKAREIGIVLRFDSQPAKRDQPQSVLNYINRAVVWYEPENDITPVVLERLMEEPRRDEPAQPKEEGDRPSAEEPATSK